MRRTLSLVVSGFVLVPSYAWAQPASTGSAQAYPGKPIQIIAPFPPGGGTDLAMRLLGQKLTDAWGQAVVYDYRSGGAGNIGTIAAARGRPDGYTLTMQSPPFTINPLFMPNVGYDPLREFAPVILASETSYVVVAHPSVPAKSIRELIALARAHPNRLNFGTSGSLAQLGGELMKASGKFNMTHIPYRGAGPALTDLIGGHLDLSVTTPTAPLPSIRAGRLRALAVTTRTRLDILADTPTVTESGIPGFEVTGWYGILAPAGTPADIVARLNAELARAVHMPDIRDRLAREGIKPIGGSPADFAAYLGRESAKWGKLIKDIGFKGQSD